MSKARLGYVPAVRQSLHGPPQHTVGGGGGGEEGTNHLERRYLVVGPTAVFVAAAAQLRRIDDAIQPLT